MYNFDTKYNILVSLFLSASLFGGLLSILHVHK